MTVYIVSFAASILLLYYAESKYSRNTEAKICSFFALLIPCMLAGLRANTIGTDVKVYVELLFETARMSDGFWKFYTTEVYQASTWSYVYIYDFEIGFDLLCYICAKLSGSISVLLFMIQALTLVPIYKGLRAFRKDQSVWLGMTVYYLMFYNNTLNMMRQWIAMALLFYGFQFLVRREYRKYFVTLMMAMLFHMSAIIGLVIAVIFRLTVGNGLYRNERNVLILSIIGILAIMNLGLFVVLIDWIGLRYAGYISGDLTLMPRQILYRIPIILLMVLRWKYLKKVNNLTCFYAVMPICDLIISQLVSVTANSGRIGVYFSEYYMLVYPAICRASSNPKNRQVLRLMVICYLCVYWWYTYVYCGSSQTIPYVTIWG